MAVGWQLILADDEGAREVTVRADTYEAALNVVSDSYPDANVVSTRRVTLPDGDSESSEE